MAKQTNNVVTHGLSGKVGDLLVFSQRGGKTVVGKVPQKRKSDTEQQKEHRRKFQRAVLYAKSALADPELREAYGKSAKTGQNGYNVAVADFFNAPDTVENYVLTPQGKSFPEQFGRFYDELGWEFAGEMTCRRDMIRFGHYTKAEWLSHKPNGDFRSVFPYPQVTVDSNPNLDQNPNYK